MPVAVMCELEETQEDISSRQEEIAELLKEHQKLRRLTWQSYLKEAKESSKGCS